ncbi:membrane protein involved in the export of O-antigen and teichoic acid [Cylindrospermum stagnale PCC 7417]|uniref:Membrane protein involved in the export of O-antigen and teichoic acid n=1 Tax=Cylindrospermum stagnale PCC 7417 TaxID=56107 RepID=K9X2V3_9NOST|nr:oligosaccharide flippase family protein [Cylindrospermum stagnale]AFZ26414.1 membrane protein involved in the export of O-antigen and teichoic acid [Cylindrospermum stagnale PCC 7417]
MHVKKGLLLMLERHRLVVNSISMLVNKLTQAVTSFVLSAAIARTLGAQTLGQYLLGISYFYIFVNLVSQGFKTLFTREIAREPESKSVYLVSGTLLQFVFCIIGYAALVLVVFLLPYSPETSLVCYIVGLTIIPFGISNITEAILQAQEKMHLIAISTVPIYILRLGAMFWVLDLHYGINAIAGIFVISETLIVIVEWLFLIQNVKPKWQIRQDFIWNTIKSSRAFFAIEGIGIIASKIDILILSLLGDELLIGIYGAMGQLVQPFSLISNSVSLAAFPNMSKAVYLGKQKQRQVTENIIELLLCMALPFFVGLLFVGQELLLFIYKDPSFYQENTGLILNIFSIAVITSSFSRTFSYLLIANGFEKFNLLEVVITTVVGGLTGIVLISQYKLLGAAFMGLAMTFTSFSTFTYVVYNHLFRLRLWRVMRRPLLISVFMLIVFLILQKVKLDFLLSLVLATCIYCLFISFLAIREFGGFNSIRQKIFSKR